MYATDRTGNLLVLDRRRGTQLAKLDVSKFVFPAQNETTDRILLAAHDGTVISLNDKAYAAPFALQNEGAKISVPAAAPAKEESKPVEDIAEQARGQREDAGQDRPRRTGIRPGRQTRSDERQVIVTEPAKTMA